MKRKTFTNLTAGIIAFSFFISLFLNLSVTEDGYSRRFRKGVKLTENPGLFSGIKNGLCMPGEAFIQSAKKVYPGMWRYSTENKKKYISPDIYRQWDGATKFGWMLAKIVKFILLLLSPLWHAVVFFWYLIAFTWSLFFMKASILYYPGFIASASVFWLPFALSAGENQD